MNGIPTEIPLNTSWDNLYGLQSLLTKEGPLDRRALLVLHPGKGFPGIRCRLTQTVNLNLTLITRSLDTVQNAQLQSVSADQINCLIFLLANMPIADQDNLLLILKLLHSLTENKAFNPVELSEESIVPILRCITSIGHEHAKAVILYIMESSKQLIDQAIQKKLEDPDSKGRFKKIQHEVNELSTQTS